MSVAVVTGSAGLIGSEAARHFADIGLDVVGIDNDMRHDFFGSDASTDSTREDLEHELDGHYRHIYMDVRDRAGIDRLFSRYGPAVELIIHAAGQPSHDWSATDPVVDFDINAIGTLNLLEATRKHAPDAAFIFCSTNKVYGDRPNELPLVEMESRYELDPTHEYFCGIREDLSIDRSLHSPLGASKLAGDILVQEYGHRFGLRTACFRAGTLTGPQHAAAELHGFLAYVMRCVMTGTSYRIYGFKGKQVRDALHSSDLVGAFDAVFRAPRIAEVYNIGGSRYSNTSVREAVELAQEIVGEELTCTNGEGPRVGDHIWWISGNHRFQRHYPDWKLHYDVPRIMREIYEANCERWKR
jgi:CDP-paratose 2-epimerase